MSITRKKSRIPPTFLLKFYKSNSKRNLSPNPPPVTHSPFEMESEGQVDMKHLTVLSYPYEVRFYFNSLPNASAPELLHFLRRHIRSLKLVPASRHSSCPVFISKNLFHSPCVFLRFDRVRRPLELPYVGSYKIVKKTSKVFTLEIDGEQHTVSIDRLKLAHLFLDSINKETPSVAPSDVITCRLPMLEYWQFGRL
ncbi:integrase catalytic domain-containing protein [Nephila pilipes]|uniref:Integrase catalytic domain-containing protein n=1 Tax=Nephila pilipes TaxID=299642 RepID=A0A8X6MV16_NEPPI|nr:integrase catalytic domain-containing protein [Nephila pilipes]